MPTDEQKPENEIEATTTAPEVAEEQRETDEPEVTVDQAAEAERVKAETVAGQSQEPEYVPNKKFKVLDQEKEFDDWVTPALNKDTEARFRELYEKAHALDHVKSKRDEERQQRELYQQKLEEVQTYFQELNGFAKGDLDRFFDEIQMPKEKVAQWLLAKLEAEEKVKELPTHLQQVYNDYGALKRQVQDLEKKNQQVSQAHANQGVQARSSELQSVLSRPAITDLIKTVDTRLGRPGAFEEQVIRHGRAEWELNKRDLSAEEAVMQVLNLIGLSPQSQDASQASKPNESAAAPNKRVITSTEKPTVIPNIKATPASATGSRPRSVDDLRKLAKEALAAG